MNWHQQNDHDNMQSVVSAVDEALKEFFVTGETDVLYRAVVTIQYLHFFSVELHDRRSQLIRGLMQLRREKPRQEQCVPDVHQLSERRIELIASQLAGP